MSNSCLTPRTTVRTYPQSPCPPAMSESTDCKMFDEYVPCEACPKYPNGYPAEKCLIVNVNGKCWLAKSMIPDNTYNPENFIGKTDASGAWIVLEYCDFMEWFIEAKIAEVGLPSDATEPLLFDSSIGEGKIGAGKLGQVALPVASILWGGSPDQLVDPDAPQYVPIDATTVRAFSGMDKGFVIDPAVDSGVLIVPYDGVYRITISANVAANESDIGNYDQNSQYAAQFRSPDATMLFLILLDMTDINANTEGGTGTGGSAGATRSGSQYVLLTAGTQLQGRMKLKNGGGGHTTAAYFADIEYIGPGASTV